MERTIIRYNPEFHITRFDFTLGKTQVVLEDKFIKEDGVQLIARERNEQINKHDKTIEKDKLENKESNLIDAALQLMFSEDNCDADGFPEYWDKEVVAHMCAKSYKERLIIAGALIAAEIDRIS